MNTTTITIDTINLSVNFEYTPYQYGDPPIQEELEIRSVRDAENGAELTELINAVGGDWRIVERAVMAQVREGVGV